ncbi:hypothetical protein H2201_003183 [Coniosporium apollinis]|uniref:Uncharacterized protein n=1 Tax=Coniosporium apollinis TaxID=61459 RepID=A0ABQ9NWL7_9PEZI|nr:hypothetical protein H2201_003183 [Coniosporium apollinis]
MPVEVDQEYPKSSSSHNYNTTKTSNKSRPPTSILNMPSHHSYGTMEKRISDECSSCRNDYNIELNEIHVRRLSNASDFGQSPLEHGRGSCDYDVDLEEVSFGRPAHVADLELGALRCARCIKEDKSRTMAWKFLLCCLGILLLIGLLGALVWGLGALVNAPGRVDAPGQVDDPMNGRTDWSL